LQFARVNKNLQSNEIIIIIIASVESTMFLGAKLLSDTDLMNTIKCFIGLSYKLNFGAYGGKQHLGFQLAVSPARTVHKL